VAGLVRTADLPAIMATAHIDDTQYGIERDVPDGLCIRSSGQGWRVYLLDRGQHTEERSFSSENDACVYFLLRALELFVRKPPRGAGEADGER